MATYLPGQLMTHFNQDLQTPQESQRKRRQRHLQASEASANLTGTANQATVEARLFKFSIHMLYVSLCGHSKTFYLCRIRLKRTKNISASNICIAP